MVGAHGPSWDGIDPTSLPAQLATRYIGQRLIYLESTASTQDVARHEANQGAPEGTVVLANTQTLGRGRFQRTWVSPPGGAILLSLVLRPRPEAAAGLPIALSLAAVRAVRETTGLPAMIKWPNDIQIKGKKLAGILIEGVGGGAGLDYIIAGIGLNVGLDPTAHEEIAALATSLARERGQPVDRAPVLASLLNQIESFYEWLKLGRSLVPEWRPYLNTLGQRVRVTWPGIGQAHGWEEWGLAEDVDEQGCLVLRRDDGTVTRLVGGEVTLREG